MVYAKEQLQTPFGFLLEMLHFVSSVTREAEALPQVSWLGIESGQALAVHGKRVELRQFRDLCSSLLKKARAQLNSKVKMGIDTKQNWKEFELENDLINIRDDYSFVSSSSDSLKNKPSLLHKFMANEVTNSFFARGINERVL